MRRPDWMMASHTCLAQSSGSLKMGSMKKYICLPRPSAMSRRRSSTMCSGERGK